MQKGSGGLKLQITIDGRAYKVDVEVLEDEESAAAPSYAQHRTAHSQMGIPNHGDFWDADEKVCYSPVTGLAIKVNVKSGDSVGAGELMLVLEAMKMETNVTAPHAGTIKCVHIEPGDSVKLKQVLVEFA